MKSKTFKFPVTAYRMMPNPYGEFTNNLKNPIVFECYVDIQNLPDNFPMETNPREQNLKTRVARSIVESLKSGEENFHIKNRGIVVSAKEVSHASKHSEITITMDDPEVHGNIDGGHTYQIILKNRDSISEKQYVRLEIIVGAEDFFQDLAKARNTSVQVKDTSIAELENKFDFIKDSLGDLSNDVAFKENDSDKRITVENLISILYTFNLQEFSDTEKQPTCTYSQKSYCVNQYIKLYDNTLEEGAKQIDNPFYKMTKIIPEILSLYDYIESTLQDKYKEAEPSGKYGALKGVQSKKEGSNATFLTEIYANEIKYKSPRSFILPILAAFRALIKENEDGFYEWKENPKEYFDLLGGQMIKNTKERSRSLGNNVNALGKDIGHWRDLFNMVDLEYKNKLIEQLLAANN
ncbi:MAG: AIPR family protein [Neisseria sp.]|nr:AIPR family protein [Neisseria sp.]